MSSEDLVELNISPTRVIIDATISVQTENTKTENTQISSKMTDIIFKGF